MLRPGLPRLQEEQGRKMPSELVGRRGQKAGLQPLWGAAEGCSAAPTVRPIWQQGHWTRGSELPVPGGVWGKLRRGIPWLRKAWLWHAQGPAL